jgi:hypothetical protein
MDRHALEYLTELNQVMSTALSLMEKLAEYPELSHKDFTVNRSCLREYVGNVNLLVLDTLVAFEQEAMLEANRERVDYEKAIRDPDDCYLQVKQREEELREQGKPSNIGILFGMRKRTLEEIMDPSFADTAEEETELGSEAEYSSAESKGGSVGDSQ